jgi:hypothetical protein
MVKITYLPLDRLDPMFAETPSRPLPRIDAKPRQSAAPAPDKKKHPATSSSPARQGGPGKQ